MQRPSNKFLLSFFAAMTVLLIAAWVFAANTAAPSPSPSKLADSQSCVLLTEVVDAQGMDSTQSFGITQDNTKPTRPLVDLIIKLTDANTSITRFDTTCTVSHDDNTTDITSQSATEATGVTTQNDNLIFRKASPGSKNWLVSFDLHTMPDFECSLAVGAGSGAAADLVTVDVRLCSR